MTLLGSHAPVHRQLIAGHFVGTTLTYSGHLEDCHAVREDNGSWIEEDEKFGCCLYCTRRSVCEVAFGQEEVVPEEPYYTVIVSDHRSSEKVSVEVGAVGQLRAVVIVNGFP